MNSESGPVAAASPNRTLVLCFDGTSNEYGTQVSYTLCVKKADQFDILEEYQCRQIFRDSG
jgi:uncharacterized protein (DUF2235 family)